MMKPKVICHIMSSVDGRLLNGRWTPLFDGKPFEQTGKVYGQAGKALGTQAWMFGKNTLQQGFFPVVFDHGGSPVAHSLSTHFGRRTSDRMFVVADPDGEITYTSDEVRGDNIIAILGEGVSEKYLEHLRNVGVSYLFAGADGNDLPLAMHRLYTEFGIESLSLQGGGIINGAFLRAGLLDELNLMVYPGIDGLSGIPSIFESVGIGGERPAAGQSLELLCVETLECGVVRLHYKFHKEAL